jgi:hypothetical protein
MNDHQPYAVRTIRNGGVVLRKGDDLKSIEPGVDFLHPVVEGLAYFTWLLEDLSESLLESFVDRSSCPKQIMVTLVTHVPGSPFCFLQGSGNVGQIASGASDGKRDL